MQPRLLLEQVIRRFVVDALHAAQQLPVVRKVVRVGVDRLDHVRQLVRAEADLDLLLRHSQIPVKNVVSDTPPRTAAISAAWEHPAMMHSAKPTPEIQMHPSRASRRMALRVW